MMSDSITPKFIFQSLIILAVVKKHLSITISEELLEWIDEFIKNSNYVYQDRSHVVTVALSRMRKEELK
jgi:metal-responsive CopG/Arc/MetJ family transcriptional regulator